MSVFIHQIKRSSTRPGGSFSPEAPAGLGVAALASMFGEAARRGVAGLPHFPPKAKRAIYLHMVGAPPQMDLFDYKPKMKDWYDKDLPDPFARVSGSRP